MIFRKANGEVVEVESDEPMTLSELRAAIGEADDSSAKWEAINKRMEAMENRPAPAPTPPPKAEPHPSWNFEVSKRDNEGRIEGMIIRPAQYLK